MSIFSVIIVPLAIFILAVYILRDIIRWLLERIISIFTNIPPQLNLKGKIFQALIKVLINNWYTYLMLLLLWGLLFLAAVGKDIIDVYITNLNEFGYLERLLSYLSVFACTLLMSIVIWILPFFLYSENREADILQNATRFYLSTKILAFVAMLPFLIITNAFYLFPVKGQLSVGQIIFRNSISFLVFLLLARLFQFVPNIKLARSRNSLFSYLEQRIKNRYLFVIIKIAVFVLLLTLLAAMGDYDIETISYVSAIYMFIGSVIVFRLLFFSDDSQLTNEVAIKQSIQKMLSIENKASSKKTYRALIVIASLAVLYYYLVPSLENTNTLYILLVVFSFFILYLDFWRNIYRNRNRNWKGIAIIATVLFIALPFLSNREQFTVHFSEYPANLPPKKSLRVALDERIRFINAQDSTGNIYIVCAMGGGSRAGYITSSVLTALDRQYTGFFNRTVCYSTVSGSSVGLYTYLKGRDFRISRDDTVYLKYNFRRNYNSSGVFGILIGDAIESLLGPVATIPKGWFLRKEQRHTYYDRNVRIRQEYDFVMQQSATHTVDNDFGGYWQKTFYPWCSSADSAEALFQAYFAKRGATVPIHLINTFEVNSGRRTVLSPFPVLDTNVFSNAMLPLQQDSFVRDANTRDIRYREAVNMSELFPLISAASHLGTKKDAQFVDGGYFENYGLATGLDVFYYLRDSLNVSKDRIKMILIKNSRQIPSEEARQFQLLAPLAGAVNSPFTGHANQLALDCYRILGKTGYFAIEFDADSAKVPLTRSLTDRHIDSMDQFIRNIPAYPGLNSFINQKKNDF